jgi:flagellar biosynthesis protein FlhB
VAEQNEDDKTEEPTPRKLEQAREKGDIIYSTEVGSALSLLAATGVVAFLSGPIAGDTAQSLIGFISMPDQYSTEPAALTSIFISLGLKCAMILGLAMLAFSVAGVVSRYVQDKPTFTSEKLQPKVEKINPIEGFKRVFGKAAAAAFLKSVAKLLVVGGALAWALWPHNAELENLSLLDPAALLPFVKDRAVALMIALASAATLLAVIDYVMTRQSFMERMKMSRREIRDEYRLSEGDPMVKAKLRQVRTQRSRLRMLQSMPQASVVVTNPTHYAVALRYEEGETPAPICLAKGVDAVAQRIREAAEEHGIPIVEDPPLARALFATAEVDEPIPKEHYEAVAKVIGFVLRLARRRGRARAAKR